MNKYVYVMNILVHDMINLLYYNIGEQVLFSPIIIYNLILAKIQRKNAKFKI